MWTLMYTDYEWIGGDDRIDAEKKFSSPLNEKEVRTFMHAHNIECAWLESPSGEVFDIDIYDLQKAGIEDGIFLSNQK